METKIEKIRLALQQAIDASEFNSEAKGFQNILDIVNEPDTPLIECNIEDMDAETFDHMVIGYLHGPQTDYATLSHWYHEEFIAPRSIPGIEQQMRIYSANYEHVREKCYAEGLITHNKNHASPTCAHVLRTGDSYEDVQTAFWHWVVREKGYTWAEPNTVMGYCPNYRGDRTSWQPISISSTHTKE